MVYLLYLLLSLAASLEPVASTGDNATVYRTGSITQDGQIVLLSAYISVHHNSGSDEQPCGSIFVSDAQLVESIVLATRMINNDSTLLPNISLAFEIRDTCVSVNYALEQSVSYVEDLNGICNASDQPVLGISGIVGPTFCNISEATTNFFRLFQIPEISIATTASFLSESRFDYFFRTIPPDFYQAKALVDIVVHFNWTYIIALHSDDVYGRDGIREFHRALIASNTNTTRRCVAITIELGDDPPNYEEAVGRMSQDWVRNASVALLFGHVNNIIHIMTVIRERVKEDPDFPLQNMQWIGTDSWGDSLPAEFHSMARGKLGVIPRFNPVKMFDDHFTSLNPQNNDNNPWFAEYWEIIFNCTLNSSDHLKDCAGKQINTTGYAQFSLVPLVFDAVYAFAYSIHNLINDKCPNGDLCPEILKENGAIKGELMRDYLLNVTFPSPSAHVPISFDANGDVPATYTIVNLQRDPNNEDQYLYVTVGTWNLTNLSLTHEVIEFFDGSKVPSISICSSPCRHGEVTRRVLGQAECCFTCDSCHENSVSIDDRCISCDLGQSPNANKTKCVMLPVTHLAWSSPWALVILILACIGIAATTIVIVIFLVHYKHELIKASSRELSAILLAGIFLCYILPFFYVAKPSAAICAIRRFGVGFCFAVSYSALLVKTNRIYRIFNRNINTSATKMKFISPLSQVLFTFAFIGVQVVIAVIWLSVEPPSIQIIPGLMQNELACGESPYVGLSLSLAYNLILLGFSTSFAFLTRKVPENFNEAKFISIAMYTICITWLAFVPTYFATVNLGTVFQTSSLAFGIILSASSSLCCLFVSKIYILLSRAHKKKLETITTEYRSKTSTTAI